MAGKMKEYLKDPFLYELYDDIRKAGPIKAISVDITHACNIRCAGCYFFAEDMDRNKAPRDEAVFDAFVEAEKARGTNFVTVIGGEPSLELGRVRKLRDAFAAVVVTNGIRKIPQEGFEDLGITISVWGDHATDRELRGNGKLEVFSKALTNYKDDPRVSWYYTTTPGNAHEIESVVDQCVANGNDVFFNFYGDLSGLGDSLDHHRGFGPVRREIDRMIEKYPDRIFFTSYMGQVISTGRLYDERWGYDVCTSISTDNEVNRERMQNGKPYNTHFRAYNPDLQSTRRCCVGEERDCGTCFDVWAHLSWIMLNMKRHLGSEREFTNWLTTMYLYYVATRIVDTPTARARMPRIHERLGYLRDTPADAVPLQSMPLAGTSGAQ